MNKTEAICVIEIKKDETVSDEQLAAWNHKLHNLGFKGPVTFASTNGTDFKGLSQNHIITTHPDNTFHHISSAFEQFGSSSILKIKGPFEDVPQELIQGVIDSHRQNETQCTFATMAELNIPGILIEIIDASASHHLVQYSPSDLYGGRMASIPGITARQHRPNKQVWKSMASNRFKMYYDFPVLFNLESAKSCVCKCHMCLSHSKKAQQYNRKYKPVMEWDLFKKCVDEIASRNFRSPAIINLFLAGESLMNKNLEKLTAYCSSKGMPVFISTNAVLLDERRSRGLLDSGIHGLYCSVDGATKETFEKIRVGADFETVVGNINRFIDIKNEKGLDRVQVGMKFVLQEANEHETLSFLDYWISRVHNVAFQSIVRRKEPNSSGGRVELTYYQDDDRRRPCCAPFMGMSIAADGKVLPCVLTNFHKPEEIMGDVTKETIDDVWHSEKYVKLRQAHLEAHWKTISMCSQCDGVLGDNAEIEVTRLDSGLIEIVTPAAKTYKHPG